MDPPKQAGKDSKLLEAGRLSIKLPPFWPEKPEIWFYQIEAQFAIQNIVIENTKFDYLISQIEPKFIEHIWDIISNDAIKDKYTQSKERLLHTFKDSENKRMRTLLTGIELGDAKPSQLLRKMQALAGADISNTALKTLWLDKLPDYIKSVLVVSDEDISKLAVMADKIMDISSCKEVYTAHSSTDTTTQDRLSRLEQQIAALPAIIRRERSVSRSSNSSNSGRRRRRQYKQDGKFCYYHFRFGKRCQPEKCKKPCAWKENPRAQQN